MFTRGQFFMVDIIQWYGIWYPNSWMVYFMENPSYKWMMTGGTFQFGKPPYGYWNWQVHPWVWGSRTFTHTHVQQLSACAGLRFESSPCFSVFRNITIHSSLHLPSKIHNMELASLNWVWTIFQFLEFYEGNFQIPNLHGPCWYTVYHCAIFGLCEASERYISMLKFVAWIERKPQFEVLNWPLPV